jgi:hypothetical protein
MKKVVITEIHDDDAFSLSKDDLIGVTLKTDISELTLWPEDKNDRTSLYYAGDFFTTKKIIVGGFKFKRGDLVSFFAVKFEEVLP